MGGRGPSSAPALPSLHVRSGKTTLTSLRTFTQDMLRKLSIVGAGTLLPTLVGATDPTMRVVLVMLVALGWLVVQVRLQPYKLQEVRRGVRPLGTRTIFPLPLQQ